MNGGWNAVRYVYQAATQVALPGPPWVIAKISSNTMKANVVLKMRLTAMIGRSSGSVTCQKTRQPVAPSTWAAS